MHVLDAASLAALAAGAAAGHPVAMTVGGVSLAIAHDRPQGGEGEGAADDRALPHRCTCEGADGVHLAGGLVVADALLRGLRWQVRGFRRRVCSSCC
jgi:hypothetical protein